MGLTAGLLALLVYAVIQRTGLRFVRGGIYALCVGGIVLVWAPDFATMIAHVLGVGRGADLITYVWILLSFIVAVNVHVKLSEGQMATIQLARWLAIKNAIPPRGSHVEKGASFSN